MCLDWDTHRLPRRVGFLEQVEKAGERVRGQGRENALSETFTVALSNKIRAID